MPIAIVENMAKARGSFSCDATPTMPQTIQIVINSIAVQFIPIISVDQGSLNSLGLSLMNWYRHTDNLLTMASSMFFGSSVSHS